MNISTGALNLLRRIAEFEDQELVHERGMGWWVGLHRVSGRYANELLRMCLISQDSFSRGDYQIFLLSGEGRAILADPEREPEIVAHLRQSLKERP